MSQKNQMQGLNALDIKTLKLLQALLELGSVTRSAERLCMSQPAASRAVGRLRVLLDDQLLVRTRRGYVLTPRAEALKPSVEAALGALQVMLTAHQFIPATTERAFRIATTDYGAAVVLSKAMRRFSREAPRSSISLCAFDSGSLHGLEQGAIDLALWADDELPLDFHFRRLFSDSYACVVRKDHPLTQTQPGALLRQLETFGQVVAMYPEDRSIVEDDILFRLGVTNATTVVRTPYFSSAQWFVADTDLVMCLPQRMALRIASQPWLTVVPLPSKELRFEYRIIWHTRANKDPGNKWLRDLLRDTTDK